MPRACMSARCTQTLRTFEQMTFNLMKLKFFLFFCRLRCALGEKVAVQMA